MTAAIRSSVPSRPWRLCVNTIRAIREYLIANAIPRCAHPWLLQFLGGVLLFWSTLPAADAPGIRLGEPTVSLWRFGLTIRAAGETSGILATLPIPMDWPEQKIKLLREDKSPQIAKLNYRTLDNGVKQLIVAIPKLAAGEEASAVLTLEVTKHHILEPTDSQQYRLPASSSSLAKFLAPSPFIESANPKIKSLAAELTAGQDPAWNRAAAPFDWVRTNVQYEFAKDIQPAVQALEDRRGDCEELTSLIIALWRAAKIPGRAVWVPEHCYPEFGLADDTGHLHWFPCQAAGADRQFGSMLEDRPILQKGDNFKVPEEAKPQRYVQPYLRAKQAAAPPEVRFLMQRVDQPAVSDK